MSTFSVDTATLIALASNLNALGEGVSGMGSRLDSSKLGPFSSVSGLGSASGVDALGMEVGSFLHRWSTGMSIHQGNVDRAGKALTAAAQAYQRNEDNIAGVCGPGE
jgi:hypothetical protein